MTTEPAVPAVSLRRNLAANFIARGWTAVIAIAFPPIYVRLMGIESYGLIGLFATLTSILNLLDLGLSSTLSKEVARLSTDTTPHGLRVMRDTVRTFEYVFWAVGVLGCLAVVGIAPTIARSWLKIEHLPLASVTQAIRLMGAVFALQWPANMYIACLLALQRQVVANVLNMVFATIKAVGAVLCLRLLAPHVDVFFAWQVGATAIHAILAMWVLATRLRPPVDLEAAPAEFRPALLLHNWRFSAGMVAISLSAMALMQADKIIMSRLVSLEQFGYYNLAWTLAGGLSMFSAPVFVAVFPRLVQLVESRAERELARIYHEATQLLSFMVCAAAVVCTVFGKEVLQAWLGERASVSVTYPIVVPLVIGSALSALMNVPYALQLAFGWTRLGAATNTVATLIIVPLTYVLASRFGARGAALGWAILNAGIMVFGMRLVHRRLLRGELGRWYARGIVLPMLGALIPALVIRGVYPFHPATRIRELAILVGVTAACTMGAAALADTVRVKAIAFVARALRRPVE